MAGKPLCLALGIRQSLQAAGRTVPMEAAGHAVPGACPLEGNGCAAVGTTVPPPSYTGRGKSSIFPGENQVFFAISLRHSHSRQKNYGF